MAKKVFLIALMVIGVQLSLWLGAGYFLHAQSNTADNADVPTKLNNLIASESSANKEILQKLDLILSNQAQIKEELNTIKVRSTHR